MKITFNIEADSAEEFAQALSVIRGERHAVVADKTLISQQILSALNAKIKADKPVPDMSTGGVVEGPNLAIIGDDPNRQEIVTEESLAAMPEVIVKVENGIEQVITMQPNGAEPEKEKKTRKTKAQVAEEKAAALAAEGTPVITEDMLTKGDEIMSAEALRAAAGLPPLTTVPGGKPITLDDLREMCYPINKAVPGSIKKLLADNGYAHIDKIPEDKYPEFKKIMEDFAGANNVELKTV